MLRMMLRKWKCVQIKFARSPSESYKIIRNWNKLSVSGKLCTRNLSRVLKLGLVEFLEILKKIFEQFTKYHNFLTRRVFSSKEADVSCFAFYRRLASLITLSDIRKTEAIPLKRNIFSAKTFTQSKHNPPSSTTCSCTIREFAFWQLSEHCFLLRLE